MIPDRRPPLWILAACLLLPAARCEPPPAQDSVIVTLEDAGGPRLSVTTRFDAATEGGEPCASCIREAVDDYERGRDPWLRGFARAGATEVTHQLMGTRRAPSGIERHATLAVAEDLVRVMPDAIANVAVEEDAAHGVARLELIHIDRPAFLRDNDRLLAQGIGLLARQWIVVLERSCDVYDYLAEHPGRGAALREELRAEEQAGEAQLLDPREAALARQYFRARDDLDSLFDDEREGSDAMLFLLTARFAPFDHDFCFDLPRPAEESTGFVQSADPNLPQRYCAAVKGLEAVMLQARPEADPPLGLDALMEDPNASLGQATYRCARYGDARALERALQSAIEPLPHYVLVWPLARSKAASE